jgi:hypothetical protein
VGTGFWVGSPKVRGSITLRWTLGRWAVWGELDSGGSEEGPVAGFCEHGNERSGSVKKDYCFTS